MITTPVRRYPVLFEKAGEYVAQSKFTALLLPSGNVARITGAPPPNVQSEKKIEDEKKSALHDHSKRIREQIGTNDAKTKQDRLDYLEEGKKVREEIEDERSKIKSIQNAKIDELKRLGIHDKYMYEIQKKTVSF